MGHRLQITLSTAHYAFLHDEADRSSISMSELVRRALDTVYGVHGEKKVVHISHSLGRRPGRRIA